MLGVWVANQNYQIYQATQTISYPFPNGIKSLLKK